MLDNEILESIRKILLATFLSKPDDVLSALALRSISDCDNVPIMATITLGAGETLIAFIGAPAGYIGINTAFYVDSSVAAVIDWTVSLDGRPYMAASAFKATAGGVNVPFMGWVSAKTLEYRVINNHTDAVTLFYISYGAWLLGDIWKKIEEILKNAGEQIAKGG